MEIGSVRAHQHRPTRTNALSKTDFPQQRRAWVCLHKSRCLILVSRASDPVLTQRRQALIETPILLVDDSLSLNQLGRLLSNMPVSEDRRKDQAEDQCVAGEGQPDAAPIFHAIDGEVIYYPAAHHAAEKGSKTVRHDHKQALSACANTRFRFADDEERAGDVEEV